MVLTGARTGTGAGRPPSAATLVGRATELAQLIEVASRAPSLVLIEGEAGVGKSRLVAELRKEIVLNPDRILVGNCHLQREPFPLQPIVEALGGAAPLLAGRSLGAVTAALRPLLPELADHLAPVTVPAVDPQIGGHQVFRALREVLGAIGPALLLLEDLHWADGATADLLSFLLAAPPPDLAMVLTFRAEDLAASSPILGLAARVPGGMASARITLSPLDREEVGRLIAAILEVDAVTEEFATYLHARTAGLPFAVEEMLRLLQDRRDLVQQDGRWARRALDRLAVPGAVRDAILQRLAPLGEPARRLVWAASVLGRPAGERELAAVGDVPDAGMADALGEVLRADLLREDAAGRAEFRHELARQAVHDAIPGPQRRRLHLRAARLLEKDRSVAATRVAHHFREAGRLDQWARHAERAAGQAAALERTDSCRILQDLQASPSLPLAVRVRLAAKLGHEPHLGLSPQGAVEIVRRVLEEESDRAARGELRLLLGHALIDAGELGVGHTELGLAIADLPPGSALSAGAAMVLADPRAMEGTLEEHARWQDQAAGIAAATPDARVRLAVLAKRAAALMMVGDPRAGDAVAEIPRRWTTVGERREAAAGLAAVAVGASYIGEYDRGRGLLAEATALVERFDCDHVLAGHDAIHLMLDFSTGAWAELEERARRLIDQQEPGPPRPSPERLVLGLHRLAASGPRSAREPLEESLDLARRAGVAPGYALAAGALARCRLADGAPAAALHVADAALEVIRRKHVWVWATEVAPPAVEALVHQGRAAEAAALVDELDRGLRGRAAPAARAALALCRGMIEAAAGRRAAAIARLEAAERAWAALPRPHDAALARERWGMLLLEREPERAIEVLTGALASLEELGADWEAARLRQLLRRHGARPPQRRGRHRYGDALSPREQEILDLVEGGGTNRQIAERLFLSQRTVENHVRRVRQKRSLERPERGRAAGGIVGSLPSSSWPPR